MSPGYPNAEGRERYAPSDADIQLAYWDLLKRRKQIAVIWGIEDVQRVRPDLDEDQADIVLNACQTWYLPCVGMSEETIREQAEESYPEPESEL